VVGGRFIFPGLIRSANRANNIGNAPLLELLDRAAANRFWSEVPLRNGGYPRDAQIT